MSTTRDRRSADPLSARLAWAVPSHHRATGRMPTLAEVATRLGWSLDQARRAATRAQTPADQQGHTGQRGHEEGAGGQQARRPGPPAERAAWHALETAGQVPTRPAVAGRLRDWERRDARRARLRAVAQRDGETAARWVATYRAEHGHGPTWAELGRAMGWPASRRGDLIRLVAAGGHGPLRFEERVERSLDVGPADFH